MNVETVRGYIHSFQSLGAVDGPGLRCVVFLQGCPLQCAYCHNPDTWKFPKEIFQQEEEQSHKSDDPACSTRTGEKKCGQVLTGRESGSEKILRQVPAGDRQPSERSTGQVQTGCESGSEKILRQVSAGDRPASEKSTGQVQTGCESGSEKILRQVQTGDNKQGKTSGYQVFTAGEMAEKVRRYRSYIKNGGVTVSGGEALTQPEFVEALFTLLHAEGIHTALDTSGIGDPKKAERVLKVTDLVIADLKFSSPENYKKYCGADLQQVLGFLALTEHMNVPLWIRQVVVPGLNDAADQIRETARIARRFSNLEKIELLPFRKLCESKYESLGIVFPLKDYPECSKDRIRELEQMISV